MQRQYKCKQKEAAKLKSEGDTFVAVNERPTEHCYSMRLANTSGEILPEKRFSPERGDLLGDHQVLR